MDPRICLLGPSVETEVGSLQEEHVHLNSHAFEMKMYAQVYIDTVVDNMYASYYKSIIYNYAYVYMNINVCR